MNHFCKKIIIASLLMIGIFSGLQAQTDSINIVSTAVPFLRISPDARAGGMGDAAIATAPEANAVFWNLAKVGFAKKRTGIAFNYTPWLRDLGLTDVYLASMGVYHKLNETSAISSSLRFFSLGNIQLTDFSGNILNTVRPTEFAIDGGYTRVLSDKMSIAVAIRYINSRLVTGDVGTGVVYRAGNSIAGDVSLFYNGVNGDGQGFSAGLAISNLGTKMGYTNDARNKDFLPANLGLGLAYTKAFNETSKITFAVDFNKLLVPAAPVATGVFSVDSTKLADYRSMSVINSYGKSFSDPKSFIASLGAEYSYDNKFFLRAGYFYEDKSRGNRSSFSAGAGFNVNFMTVNVSYLVPSGSGITRNPLSNTLRLGVVFSLGED